MCIRDSIKCGKQIAESLRLHRGMKKKEAMEEAIRMMRAVGIANPEVRACLLYTSHGKMVQRRSGERLDRAARPAYAPAAGRV